MSLLALLSIGSTSKGFCNDLICEPKQCFFSPLVEVKAGYFFFSDSKMRKIYKNGGLDLQLCASYPLFNMTNRWTINAYGAIEYFRRSGKSINGHQKTSLWSIPVNVGLKSIYTINSNIQYYFGIGPRYFYVNQHNHSSHVYKNKSKNGVGFFVNSGFNWFLCKNFVADIFGEYSYAKAHFHSRKARVYTRNIQIGGFSFGGGLGYLF